MYLSLSKMYYTPKGMQVAPFCSINKLKSEQYYTTLQFLSISQPQNLNLFYKIVSLYAFFRPWIFVLLQSKMLSSNCIVLGALLSTATVE